MRIASTASPGGPWVVMQIWACEADVVLSDGGVHAVGCTMLLREVGGKLLTLDAESLSKWSPFYKKDVPDAFFFFFIPFISRMQPSAGKPSSVFLHLWKDYLFWK